MTVRRSALALLLLLPLSLPLAFAAPVAANTGGDVVALWHLDEPEGTTRVADSSGRGNDGRPVSLHAGRPGKIGTAYAFDHKAIVEVPSARSLNPGNAAVSVSLYLRTEQLVTSSWNLIQKGLATTPGGNYKIELRPQNGGETARVACHFRGSAGSASLTAGPDVADGRWHQITCRKTSSTIILTVDGRTRGRLSASVGSISNTSELVFGAKFPGEDQLVGRLDEVAVRVG